MRASLQEILDHHGSDKASKHGYHVIYEKAFTLLKNLPISFLEIGVFKGSSMAAWEEFFINAELIGLDLFKRIPLEKVREKCKEAVLVKGDSTNPPSTIRGKMFSVIIDDGCHFPEIQARTLKAFWPQLEKGGEYFIEDVWMHNEAHPWTSKHSVKYKPEKFRVLKNAIADTEAKVQVHDLRENSGQPDSCIIQLTK